MSANGTRFFSNRDCQYYPCHDIEDINCLFCFCPLYPSINCGGAFIILPNGIKDCSGCTYPHIAENYEDLMSKLVLVIDLLIDRKVQI